MSKARVGKREAVRGPVHLGSKAVVRILFQVRWETNVEGLKTEGQDVTYLLKSTP